MTKANQGFKVTVAHFIAEHSRSLRYSIVKRLAPTLYHEANRFWVYPRPTISFIREEMGNTPLVGAEIGVAEGKNAQSIMETLEIAKLFLVDPYGPHMQDGVQCDSTKFKAQAEKRLNRWRKKIAFVRLTSDEAAPQIPDGLDFVYVDACHDYKSVRKDIQNYFPKLKEKGVIGGHDFDCNFPGVMRAVLEFTLKNGFELKTEGVDWWILKPA